MATLWLEVTSWKGVAVDRTLFGPVVRLGWVSVGYSKYALTAWVDAWRGALKAALGKDGEK